MRSKFTEAFASLKSDNNVKYQRSQRILSSLKEGENQKTGGIVWQKIKNVFLRANAA